MLRDTRGPFSPPVENAVEHDTTNPHEPARVEWLWVNDFSPNEYHIWYAWPSTCWHREKKSPTYEAPIFTAQTREKAARVSRRMDRRISGVIEFYVSANDKK